MDGDEGENGIALELTTSKTKKKWRKWVNRMKESVQDASELECQLSWLGPVAGITLLLGVLLLPGVALIGFDRGWASKYAPGFKIHIGWKKGCVAGFEEIAYKNVSGHGLVWVPCSERFPCTGCSSHLIHEILQDSGSELLGMLFPLVYGCCLVLPLIFCLGLPRLCPWCCTAAFGRSWRCDGAWWGHFASLSLVIMVQMIWIALGAGIIALSLLFVWDVEAEVGKRSTAVVSVTCSSSGLVCSEVKRLAECEGRCVLGGQGSVQCDSVGVEETCWLDLTYRSCNEIGSLCTLSHSWGFVAAISSGAVLAASGILLTYLFCKSFEVDD